MTERTTNDRSGAESCRSGLPKLSRDHVYQVKHASYPQLQPLKHWITRILDLARHGPAWRVWSTMLVWSTMRVWPAVRAKHAGVYSVDRCVFGTHGVFRSHGVFVRHRDDLLDARHCWAPWGTVMTRGASPRTTPKVVRFFGCQANDAAVVCTH